MGSLTISNVTKTFGSTEVLKGINIDIADLIYNSGFPEPPESTVDDPVVYGRTYFDIDPDDDDTRASGSWVETATKEEIDKISQDIIDINVDIGDLQGGGSFPEAPEDGNQYARQDAGWSEVVIPDVDLTGYATEVYVDGAIAAIPAAPVDSVNGKTGVVVLSAADVGALPNTYDPGINYPVTSVNSKTGAVTLTHTDVGAQVAGSYAASNHNHTGVYQPAGSYAASNHDHTGVYAAVGASYTKAESDSKWQPKGSYAASSHNHTGVYQPAGSYAAAVHTHAYSSLTGLPTLYTGADAVKTSGNQDVAGIKRFTSELRCSANIIAYYSDIRLKDIQGQIENPVEKVKAIETFYYIHGDRARELGYEGSELQVGVSAQSVQAVAPELIHRAPVDDDGEGGSVTGESYITVDYPRLVPLLIESIKQLSAEIEELKK